MVLRGDRAMVLAIWMIVLLILGRVDRMVDFLLTRFENKVEVPSNFLPSNGCSVIGGSTGDVMTVDPFDLRMRGSCSLGPSLTFTRVCALPWKMFHCCTL